MPEIVCAWLRVPLQLFNHHTDHTTRFIRSPFSPQTAILSTAPDREQLIPATSAHSDSVQPNQTHTTELLTPTPSRYN